MKGLTIEQKAQYERDGYTILKSVFSKVECETFIEHMMTLHSGQKTLEGFAPREPNNWGRTHNQHLYDPKALALLIDSRLHQQLEDCFEDRVEGIQTMYFYKGSEGRRHQDQCPLPGCMSAWLPLVDVNEENGTIYVQPGSHKEQLVTYWETLDENGKMDYEYRHKKERDGYTILKSVFSKAECETFIEHMMTLHSGQKTLEGFAPHEPNNWGRTHNQHLYDPKALALLIDSRLHQPLEDCFEDKVEGIQTMYFYKGSEGNRHQDQCPLPGCMSAWLPLVDVNEGNGTIYIQPGSHKGQLVTYWETLDENGKMDYEYRHKKTERIFEENNCSEVSVIANQGDAVLFHGRLIHRGGPIKQPGALRHVMANHYIPYQFTDWPHTTWPRISFNGKQRHTD